MHRRPLGPAVRRAVAKDTGIAHALRRRTHQHQASSRWVQRGLATSASYSADDCLHRAFAKAHPEAARRILSVPPFSYSDVSSCKSPPIGGDKDTLEHFLQWRGWDVDGILREYQLTSEIDAAVGLLSHPLTFPLTLGRHFQALLPETPSADVKKQIRMCCVGARAECTLPDDFWRELLVAAVPLNNQCGLHCTIDFVGPDVPKHLTSKTISLVDGDGCSEQQPKYDLTLNYHTSFLHEIVLNLLKSSHATNTQTSSNRTEQIRLFWDGFVLFNPGLGHPNLGGQWEPTLKFLAGTGKPLLLTAHSTLDAERDRAVLETLLTERDCALVQYDANPFASRMSYADPFGAAGEEVHIVRPNHSVFLLQ